MSDTPLEATLREQHYRMIARMVPVGIAQVTDDDRVCYTNPAFRHYFGKSKILTVAQILDVLGARRGFPGSDSAFTTKIDTDGVSCHLQVSSSGWLHLPGNTWRSAVLSIIDTSENEGLRRINEEVANLNAELAASLGKLEQAQEALVNKGRMEQMGQITATIAHELRNPMGAVRASAFLLERKLKGKDLGIEQQLQRINNGISRCDSIITQLLDFSRTKKLAAEADDLDKWLSHVLEDEAGQLASCITLTCELGLDGQRLPFDRSRLQRAISNLVKNAAEAMVGDGNILLSGAQRQPAITITTRRIGEMAEISVSDNGPGMSQEILARVREPLFTTKSFGTGLGISAVEQIVIQHGGTLSITSEPGVGSKFVITLPLAPSTSDQAA